jgi:hypothetical protein
MSIRGGCDLGKGSSSSQGAEGQRRRRECSRGSHVRVENRRIEAGPLKLTTGIPSLCTESAGANRAGSRKAPQLTFLVHEHCSARKLHAVGPLSGESRTRPPE